MMTNEKAKYVIISPVRDEADYIEQTLRSVISQTVKPIEWVIVNDGSTDGTGGIIDRYAKEYPWIVALHRSDRGYRNSAGGEVDTFYEGYRTIRCKDWHFVVKLDGDLSFESNYFERCLKYFRRKPELGIAGGMIYNVTVNGLKMENIPLFHVRGATKIYRKRCWEDIGMIKNIPGWDTIDEVKANMLGWETRTFPDIHMTHHRYTGTADGLWRNALKNGLANYIAGYHPLFMALKCVKRLPQKPFVLGSVGLAFGFLKGYIQRVPRIEDPDLICYLRKQQMNKLLFRNSIWK